MRNDRHIWNIGAITLLAATVATGTWAAALSNDVSHSLPSAATASAMRGVTATNNDSASESARQHDRTVATESRSMVTETPGNNVQRAPQLRPRTTPGAKPVPVVPGVVPLKIAPLPRKLPGRLMTPALIVTGDTASSAGLPAAIATAALVVTGAADTPPTLPATVNTAALAVTGVADTPPTLPSSIAVPGLVVTGEGP